MLFTEHPDPLHTSVCVCVFFPPVSSCPPLNAVYFLQKLIGSQLFILESESRVDVKQLSRQIKPQLVC